MVILLVLFGFLQFGLVGVVVGFSLLQSDRVTLINLAQS